MEDCSEWGGFKPFDIPAPVENLFSVEQKMSIYKETQPVDLFRKWLDNENGY